MVSYFVFYLVVVLLSVDDNCRERLISEMTDYVSS